MHGQRRSCVHHITLIEILIIIRKVTVIICRVIVATARLQNRWIVDAPPLVTREKRELGSHLLKQLDALDTEVAVLLQDRHNLVVQFRVVEPPF